MHKKPHHKKKLSTPRELSKSHLEERNWAQNRLDHVRKIIIARPFESIAAASVVAGGLSGLSAAALTSSNVSIVPAVITPSSSTTAENAKKPAKQDTAAAPPVVSGPSPPPTPPPPLPPAPVVGAPPPPPPPPPAFKVQAFYVDKIGGLANLFKITQRKAVVAAVKKNSVESFVTFKMGNNELSLANAKVFIKVALLLDELNKTARFDGSTITERDYLADMDAERVKRVQGLVASAKLINTGFGQNSMFNVKPSEVYLMLGKFCKNRQCNFDVLDRSAKNILSVCEKLKIDANDILKWTDLFDDTMINEEVIGAWYKLGKEAKNFDDLSSMLLIETDSGRGAIEKQKTLEIGKINGIFKKLTNLQNSLGESEFANIVRKRIANSSNLAALSQELSDKVDAFFKRSATKCPRVGEILQEIVEKTLVHRSAPQFDIPFDKDVAGRLDNPKEWLSCELDLLLKTNAVMSRTIEERLILKMRFSRISYFGLPMLLAQPNMFSTKLSGLPSPSAESAFLYAYSKVRVVQEELAVVVFNEKVSKLLMQPADNKKQQIFIVESQHKKDNIISLSDQQVNYIDIELLRGYPSVKRDRVGSGDFYSIDLTDGTPHTPPDLTTPEALLFTSI